MTGNTTLYAKKNMIVKKKEKKGNVMLNYFPTILSAFMP